MHACKTLIQNAGKPLDL
jgi:hypothetical protein